MGVPIAPIIMQPFEDLVKETAREEGMPYERFIYVPTPVSSQPRSVVKKYLEGNDPVTGKPVMQEIIDALANALTAMGRDPEGLTALLPVTINEFEYVGNPESVQDAVKDAEDAKDQLQLFGTTIPMALIAVGLLAILAGWYLYFVAPGRKQTTQSPG